MLAGRDAAAGPIDRENGISVRAQRPDPLGGGGVGFLEVEILAAGTVVLRKRDELAATRVWRDVINISPGDLSGADTWRLTSDGFETSIRVEVGPALVAAQPGERE